MLCQLLLRFVLAVFLLFSLQSGLSLGLGDYKFSKLRQRCGQEIWEPCWKRLRLGKKIRMSWRDGSGAQSHHVKVVRKGEQGGMVRGGESCVREGRTHVKWSIREGWWQGVRILTKRFRTMHSANESEKGVRVRIQEWVHQNVVKMCFIHPRRMIMRKHKFNLDQSY